MVALLRHPEPTEVAEALAAEVSAEEAREGGSARPRWIKALRVPGRAKAARCRTRRALCRCAPFCSPCCCLRRHYYCCHGEKREQLLLPFVEPPNSGGGWATWKARWPLPSRRERKAMPGAREDRKLTSIQSEEDQAEAPMNEEGSVVQRDLQKPWSTQFLSEHVSIQMASAPTKNWESNQDVFHSRD